MPMEQIYKIRRETLRRYMIEECDGKMSDLADLLDIKDTSVSRFFSVNNPKTIGEKLARKIEVTLNKPAYWLDGLTGAAFWPFPSIDIKRINSLTKQEKEKLANSIDCALQLMEPGKPPAEQDRRRKA